MEMESDRLFVSSVSYKLNDFFNRFRLKTNRKPPLI